MHSPGLINLHMELDPTHRGHLGLGFQTSFWAQLDGRIKIENPQSDPICRFFSEIVTFLPLAVAHLLFISVPFYQILPMCAKGIKQIEHQSHGQYMQPGTNKTRKIKINTISVCKRLL